MAFSTFVLLFSLAYFDLFDFYSRFHCTQRWRLCASLQRQKCGYSGEQTARGERLLVLGGMRDPIEEPIGFLVFALEARVGTVSTNPRRRFAHVDVM